MADHHKRGVEDATLPTEATSSALEDADFHPQKGNTYKCKEQGCKISS
jgi:hypothetical protein